MRPCLPALAAFLNNPANIAAVIIDLYTFQMTNGATFRYSSWTSALTLTGDRFPSGSLNANQAVATFALGPRFGKSKITTKVGIDPAELDVEIYAYTSDVVGNLPFATAVRQGQFDGAIVELDRLFSPPTGSGSVDLSLGCLVWFYGHVADADVGRSKITLKVKSLMNLLAIQQMPRRVYMASCSHKFGDPMCGYDRINGLAADGTPTGIGAVTIAAQPGSTQSDIITTFNPSPSTAYYNGTTLGLTGANAGQLRTTNLVYPNIFMYKPWLSVVNAGDQFELLPGCDHTTATCNNTFHNLPRYGGMPYIPPPEFAL